MLHFTSTAEIVEQVKQSIFVSVDSIINAFPSLPLLDASALSLDGSCTERFKVTHPRYLTHTGTMIASKVITPWF